MKKLFKNVLLVAVAAVMTGCASSASTATEVDLNSLTVDQIVEEAKKEGEINSVAMPDSWANWGETWTEIEEIYGIKHTDVDMSSAEELALFEAEKNNATKDIGDVGQSFGPIAVEKGLSLPYKTSYWDSIPDWAKDEDGHYIIAYYGTISFLVNTDIVETAPTSFDDLLNGDYKVAIGDVTTGTQPQSAVLAAAIANGGSESDIQPGLDYFAKLAEQGRIDQGELNLARIEKGEIGVAILWDYNALGYKDLILENNPNMNFQVNVPTDGSVQSGYTTIINAYTQRPHAAALAREYILSDEGQINLAKGYAKPVRDVELPAEVEAAMIPDEQYVNARFVEDMDAWDKTAAELPLKWKEEVMVKAGS